MERTYGAKYDPELKPKEIARRVRLEIRAAVKAGELPADWTYSVRFRWATHSPAIDATCSSPRPIRIMDPGSVAAAPGRDRYVTLPIGGALRPVKIRAGERWEIHVRDVETAEAARVGEIVGEMLAAYNYNGSDTMADYYDVNFYGGATVTTLPGVPWSERERPAYLPASCTLEGRDRAASASCRPDGTVVPAARPALRVVS